MTLFDFEAVASDGSKHSLSEYQGKVLLFVNTASKCGYAVQFDGLQKLYDSYRDRGFEILGFPSGQFRQEFDDETQITQFCRLQHGVTFPMFAKVDVLGPQAHPIFKFLTREAPGVLGTKSVKWNFTKFLVDQKGRVIRRFAPSDTPDLIEPAILELLNA